MTSGDRIAIAGGVLALIVALFGAAGLMVGRVDQRIDRLDTRLSNQIAGIDTRLRTLETVTSHIRGQLDILSRAGSISSSSEHGSTDLQSALADPQLRAASTCNNCHAP